MQPSKWDLVLEQRPVPLMEHLVQELAALFARDLSAWPPAIEAFDDATAGALRPLLAETVEPPGPAAYREAFRLAQLDLSREFEALDDYWRNRRFGEAGLAAADAPLLQFLSRFMTEQLLALGEATEGRINRPRMLQLLERTRTIFFSGMTP